MHPAPRCFSWAGKQWWGEERSPHIPRQNGQRPATPLRQTGEIHARVDLRELAKPLSTISQQSQLTEEVTVDWKLASMTPTRRMRRNRGTTGLSVWPQCWKRSWIRSSWVPSHGMCRTARELDSANMGLWKASPAWLTWSSMVRSPA